MQKRIPNGQLLKEKMDLTFALRRKEVVESEPAISEMLQHWPALFTEDQDSDDDDSFRNIDIGILLVEPEGAVPSSSLHLSPASLKIIIEGEVVMDNIQDLPKAMCILFGLS
ncbi:hypothetical protein AMECASPLE_023401 [Ameca splendens]|uniref:Uncharacterized protein n=1 Tax=Ameca splendens TaxID=208324 RepID=A0ABV0Y454_9TELE